MKHRDKAASGPLGAKPRGVVISDLSWGDWHFLVELADERLIEPSVQAFEVIFGEGAKVDLRQHDLLDILGERTQTIAGKIGI